MFIKCKKVLAFFSLAIAGSMVLLDSSVVAVALPTIQRQLNVSTVGVQWVVNAYFLAVAAFIIAGGRLGDVFGHKKFFCIGTLLFSLTSISCGLAPWEDWLIYSRALQGIAGAIMLPCAMTLLVTIFPSKKRGQIIGWLTAVSALFLVCGPYVGGYLSEAHSWRCLFFANVPLGILSLCFGIIGLPRLPRKREAIDYIGFIFLAGTLTFFTLVVMMGRVWGWESRVIQTCLVLCFVCGALLYIWSKKRKSPFVDITLCMRPLFLGGLMVIFLLQFLLAVPILGTVYLQKVLFLSPFETGIVTAVSALPILALAPISGFMCDNFGPRLPLTLGFILVVGGCLWIALAAMMVNLQIFIPGLVCFGSGMALLMTPIGSITVGASPQGRRGEATGIYNTFRYMGGTVGVAVLGFVFTAYREMRFALHASLFHLDLTAFYGILNNMQPALDSLAELPAAEATIVRESLLLAYCDGFVLIAFIAACVGVVGYLVAMRLLVAHPLMAQHDTN